MFEKRYRHHTVKPFLWATVIIVFLSLLALIAFKDDEIKLGRIADIADISSPALAAEQTPVLPKWPHETSDLLPDPSVYFGRLPNGFRYVLMENQTPRDRVSIHLNIQAGSLQESDAQQGLAHFLEHMLFNGSTHFEPGELVKYFQSIGMEFGPDANAFTGFDYTVYMMLLPEGNRENLEQGLIVMKDYAEGALLLQSEIDRERGIVLSEKRTRDSASYRTFTSTMKFEFPESRVSRRFPIGTEAVLKNADRNLFKDFYDTWYRPDRMTLVMVGDFDIQPTIDLVETQFSTLSARAPPKPDPDIGKINHRGNKTFYHFEKEAGNTSVSIEVVHGIEKKADSETTRKKDLFRDLANRIMQHRLDALIRKPDTPFTSASIGTGTFLDQIEYAEISSECSPENWKESLSLLEQTLRGGLKYGFSLSELERVKKDYLANLDDDVNKASTRNSRSLTAEIRHTINNNLVFLSPEQKRALLAPFVKSATLKQVHDAFKRVWAPDHRLILVTGNADLSGKPDNPENTILAAFKESNGVAVAKPVETKTITFPYLPEPSEKGQIKSRTFLADLGILQIDFSNGLRLNLKKTDFESDEIQVSLSFGHGRSREPETSPGLSALSQKVINESGFGRMSKDEIERALAGKKSAVYFRADDDHFSFYGSTVPKELTLFFQLLYAHITDPGFREDAYTLSMARFDQEYQELARSIDGALTLEGKRFLAGGDSRFGLPSYEVFSKLTLEQVRSWVYDPLKNEPLEVSVVGDVEIEPVVDVVSKYLGSIPRRIAETSKKRSRSIKFPRGQSLEIKVETEIPKGIVIVAYPTEDTWNIHRNRRLAVLGNVFSDRLRENIREKLGAAYTAFAFNSASRTYPGYGVLQARVYVDPDQADIVIEEIKAIVSALSKDGIEKDELKRALEPTRTSIKEMVRTNGYWLNTVMSGSERHPEQIDWSRTIIEDYASITTEDLSSLARKYLKNDQAATIVIKPE